MIRPFFVSALAALLLVQSACQSSKQATAASNVDPSLPLDKTLLWEITGKGISKPSYLFGTIHLMPEADFFYPNELEAKFKTTKRLVTEIDMGKQLEMAFKTMAIAPMKGGKKLSDLLTAEEYQMVKDYFNTEVEEIKMVGFKMFENYKPMLLSGMLYGKMIEGKPKTYEMELVNMAQAQDKETGGLETFEYQMSVFDTIPYPKQARQLYETIESLKSDKDGSAMADYRKMVDIYKLQDVDGMYTMTMKDDDDYKEYEGSLLTNRNHNWIPEIIKMAKEKPTFFAVGAGHLGGPDGVIRLLRKAGYTLTPVK